MNLADEKKKLLDDDLAPLSEGQVSSDHDAWLQAEIRKTLARKKSGEMSYTSLDDVMRRFGF